RYDACPPVGRAAVRGARRRRLEEGLRRYPDPIAEDERTHLPFAHGPIAEPCEDRRLDCGVGPPATRSIGVGPGGSPASGVEVVEYPCGIDAARVADARVADARVVPRDALVALRLGDHATASSEPRAVVSRSTCRVVIRPLGCSTRPSERSVVASRS